MCCPEHHQRPQCFQEHLASAVTSLLANSLDKDKGAFWTCRTGRDRWTACCLSRYAQCSRALVLTLPCLLSELFLTTL